jgi:hypothetical protein
MKQINTFAYNADGQSDFTKLEQEARKLIGQDKKNLVLLAWWDSSNKTGGPREACSDETIACVTSYAIAHGCEYRVRVNGDQYDLFYGTPSGNYVELDSQMVAEVHRQAKHEDFDNVQGG